MSFTIQNVRKNFFPPPTFPFERLFTHVQKSRQRSPHKVSLFLRPTDLLSCRHRSPGLYGQFCHDKSAQEKIVYFVVKQSPVESLKKVEGKYNSHL